MQPCPLTLLVISSRQFLRDDLSQILTRWESPVELRQAGTREAALEALDSRLDLVLFDPFTFPGQSGSDEDRAIRHRAGEIPMICLLPADTRDYRDAAVECGANAFILLECLPTDLLPVMKSLLSSASQMRAVTQCFQENARQSAPAGESLFASRPESNLETRSFEAMEHRSARIAPLPPAKNDPSQMLPGGTQPLFLRHLYYSGDHPTRPAEERVTRTACNHDCGFHYCGMKVTVRDQHVVKIEPADFPKRSYRGVCQKGISYVQILSHPDRLLYPLKRVGPRGAGRWERISWDQALDEIAARMQALAGESGPESMMFLTSKGQAGVLNGFFGVYLRLASVLGASSVDPQGLGIDTGVASGFEEAFGTDAGFLANAFEDLPNTRLVLVWGSNPVQSWSPWWPFFLEAKRRGAKLITIDPRYTPTATRSDLWLPIRPGTDVILAWALIHQILEQGWADLAYVSRHTVGPFLVRADNGQFLQAPASAAETGQGFLVWDRQTGSLEEAGQAQEPALTGEYRVNGVVCRPAYELLRQAAGAYPLQLAAEKTGLKEDQILALAREFAGTKPARIFTAFGVERWYHASTFGRLMATLSALTGNLGIQGGGAGISGFFEFPVPLDEFAYPDQKTFLPVNPAELPRYIVRENPYPIKGMLVAFCNWLNQFSDRSYLLDEVLPKLDLLVTADLFLTETANWSDYVLPVAAFFEREDMVKGPGPYVQYQPRIVPPPGECRSDLEIARELACRFGQEAYFSEPPAVYLQQALSRLDPRLDHAAFDVLRTEGVLDRSLGPEALIPHAGGRFSTFTGRMEFYSQRLAGLGLGLPVYEPPAEVPEEPQENASFPLVCISAHSHYRVNSIFGQAAWLKELDPEPYAFLHPSTAGKRQIQDGDWVRLYNDRGYVILKARVSQAIPPQTVYLNAGWPAGSYREGHIQSLTHRKMNPTNALGPSLIFSDLMVEVRRVENAGEGSR